MEWNGLNVVFKKDLITDVHNSNVQQLCKIDILRLIR